MFCRVFSAATSVKAQDAHAVTDAAVIPPAAPVAAEPAAVLVTPAAPQVASNRRKVSTHLLAAWPASLLVASLRQEVWVLGVITQVMQPRKVAVVPAWQTPPCHVLTHTA